MIDHDMRHIDIASSSSYRVLYVSARAFRSPDQVAMSASSWETWRPSSWAPAVWRRDLYTNVTCLQLCPMFHDQNNVLSKLSSILSGLGISNL